MKLLFIGNSHTYYNSMPEIVMQLLEATGQKCHVTMLTKGGESLSYHASSPNTLFNIRCGKYDAVIAQDRATGFDPVSFRDSAKLLRDMAEKAGSQFFLYMPWAARENRAAQHPMTEAYHNLCRSVGCSFAPAGEVFSRLLLTEPADLLYREDGNHATPIGSYFLYHHRSQARYSGDRRNGSRHRRRLPCRALPAHPHRGMPHGTPV